MYHHLFNLYVTILLDLSSAFEYTCFRFLPFWVRPKLTEGDVSKSAKVFLDTELALHDCSSSIEALATNESMLIDCSATVRNVHDEFILIWCSACSAGMELSDIMDTEEISVNFVKHQSQFWYQS